MKWTVTGPDGQQYKGVEAGSADEAKRIVQERQPRAVGAAGHSGSRTTEAPQDFGSTPANLAAGFGQGLLDPLEGVGQMAEHIPYVGGAVRAVIPDALRNWAKNYQQRVGASTAGSIGEFAGNVLPFLFQPELGIARAAEAAPGVAGKLLGAGGRLFERGTLPATLEPTQSQPTRDPLTGKTEAPTPFWEQKGEQAALGTAVAAPFEGLAAALGRVGGSARGKIAAANQAQQAANALAGSQAWRRSAQTLAHQTGKTEQAGEQQARTAATDVLKQIPSDTTSEWWRRTLGHIGVTDADAARPVPESGAKVRKIVGDRMNELTDRMTLDPHDPSFKEALDNERERVLSELTESERAGWFTKGQERSPLESTITDQYGRPARTTRRDPTRATGDFATTVMEPLEKGPLTGRALTEYNRRLGDKAEEFVRRAQSRPKAEADELYARAGALRRIQDAVLGHAAGGNADDKLAMEATRRAYRMWAIGNDAARVSNRGVATPKQMLDALRRRLGKGEAGEARLKEALANPTHPDHETATWLNRQLDRISQKPPTVRPDRAIPRKPPEPSGRTPPTPAEHVSLPALLAGHAALSHIPGNHLLPWGTRHPLARRIGGYLSRAATPVTRRVTGNVPRRLSAPASAGASNIVKQTEEPDMSYSAPPGFGPPR